MCALAARKYTLKYVQSVSRHGARTTGYPEIRLFNNQPAKVPHQLTDVGVRQHFLLGAQYYRLYNSASGTEGKLYDQYKPQQVTIMASGKQRTIASARAQIKGLFSSYNPKSRGSHFLQFAQFYESYQQIPILSYTLEEDPFRSDWCTKAKEVEKELKKGEGYKQLEQKYRSSLFPSLAPLMGTTVDNLTLSYVNHVRDVVETLDADGFDIGRFKPFLAQLKRLHFDYKMLTLTSDPQALKAKVTNYLRASASYLKQATGEKYKPMQLFFYHDTTLVELAAAMGIDMKNLVPPYASTIVFQLWEDEEKKARCAKGNQCLEAYSVKTLYNDEMVLQEHQSFNEIGAIPLSEWIQFVEKITMEEEEVRDYCEVDEGEFEKLQFVWKLIA